jgi:hypothetical protein
LKSARTSKPDSSATKAAVPPPLDKLYWLRIGLGFASGVLTEELTGMDAYNGISIGILVFLVSYYFARFVWYRGVDKRFQSKLYTTGLGGYIGMFLFSWILLFTLASA